MVDLASGSWAGDSLDAWDGNKIESEVDMIVISLNQDN